jgi:hypothetical protein
MPWPPGPRPVNHIETTSAEWYDPYADPYQNPWKDYEEYEPYSEGTYHIRPNPLPQHHVAFNKPEVTADYPPISDQDDSGYEKAESQTSGGRGPFTTSESVSE